MNKKLPMDKLKRGCILSLALITILPYNLLLFITFSGGIPSAEAATATISTPADFNSGAFNGTEAASKSGELRLQASGTWEARVWKTPQLALGDQTAIVSDGTYLYVKVSGDNLFTRYDPATNTWKRLLDAPAFSFQGSDMRVLDGNIYTIFGGYQKEFYKYSIALNTWTKLASMPDLVYSGASLGSDGTNLFVLRGAGTTDFWKYTVSSNSWNAVSSAPAAISTGGSLVYSGGYFYTPRGGNQTTFYKYDVSGNSWSTMTAVPATLNSDGNITVNGDYIYILRGGSTNTFYRYSISGNSWTTLTNTPQVTGFVGAVYHSGDGYIYVFRGNGTQEFWKYSISGNSFVGQSDLPNTPGTGADLINHQGYLYFVRGNSSTNLYRFDLSAGTWSAALAAFPATMADDVKGASAGAYLYFPRGSSTTTLYRYDTQGNSFTTLSASPATLSSGSTVAYPGTGNYLYITRGGNSTTFYRYSISGDTWDDAGAADLPSDSPAGIGSRIITDGTDVYFISGSGTSRLLKYTVASNTWAVINNTPFATYYGTDMSYYNGNLYIQAGYYKSDFWEYKLSTNTWRRLSDLETYQPYSQGPYNGAALVSDGGGNFYSTYGANVLWWQKFTLGSTNYPASGTWTSSPIDLTYVAGWTGLTGIAVTPSNSSVSYETRSSTDMVTWSSWQSVSSGTIQSPARRYIQVKVTLSSSTGQVDTPTVTGVTVNYTGDASAPTNPGTFTAKSQSVSGVTLTDSVTYSYTNPYFTWSGATDSETTIAGYYVYFGTSSSADPQTLGAYQTTAAYTVITPLVSGNTYYLRLKTQDTAGNISSATTAFTYIYQGVNATTTTKTSTSDFSGGTESDTTTLGDEIKLASKSGFWIENRLSIPPAGLSSGASWGYAASTNKLYSFRGSGTQTFYEYDIATDVWATKTNAPATVTTGGALAGGPSGYIYAARGGNTTTFWRYDPSGNTWDDAAAADAPQPFSGGSSLVYDGSRYIYALKGNADDTFMRYDTTNDTWDTLANTDFNAPTDHLINTVTTGGDLALGDSDSVYAIQGGGYSGFAKYSISANSWTQLLNLPAAASAEGAQIEYDSTSNTIYYFPANSKTAFFKYDIGADIWSELSDAPATLTTSAAMKNVDGVLYILRGGGTQNFYTYDTIKSSWRVPNYNLFDLNFRGSDIRTFNTGAQIVKGSGNFYYIARGVLDSLFIRYDASSGTVVKLSDIPAGMTTGSSFVYDSVNNKIYATANNLIRRFFVYDVAQNYWYEETLDSVPAATGAGASMKYDGSRYIYLLRGGGTTTLYRYDTQGTAGSRWSTMAVAPGTIGAGASMVIKGGYMYVLRGNSQISFYRYDISANTWSDPAVADLTAGVTIGADGFLIDGGSNTLYACRGLNTVTCYSYNISGNSWTITANAPANITTGGTAAGNGTDRMYMIAGPGTNTFSNGLYSYVMQSATSSFEESGSFISPSINLGSTYKFANISVTYASATDATLTVKTRTSSDNSTWSSWSQASEVKQNGSTYQYKVNSTPNDFIQVEFDFTSGDGIYSGVVSDYSVSYYTDATTPTNPSSISAYSTSTQAAALTTNNWYNHSSPYFSWPAAEISGGATDTSTGSGVSGYYVYFGTDASADASVSGSLQSTTAYTAGSLTSGETYYLRVKTADNAGNTASTNWAAFTYRYDNVVPDNPTTVTANPSGYTATNSFAFSWSGATDSASTVSDYCYKTSLNGSETCGITDTSISGVTAGGTGASTFYVRARDIAGNKAATYSSVSYYYSATAPSAPQSLEVSPETNTVNQFSFSWDPPSTYFGSQSSLRYYYSINALPTAQNVNLLGLSVTTLATDAYATVPGANVLYVVAKDEAGNIDYNNYASVTFTADTSAPGIPKKVDIADISVKTLSAWKLAVSWEAPDASGSGVSSYKVYSSTTSGASCTTDFSRFSYLASTTGRSYVDTDITQNNHYYCVKACDSTNNCSAVSSTVTKYPTGKYEAPAELTASPSATVRTKSAVITWGTSRSSNSFVKYGTSSGDYGTEVGSSTQVTAHTINLLNLAPGTTYYYKVLWTDEDGNIGSSTEQSITTEPAPLVGSVKVANISINSANVSFSVANATSVTVQYGLTTNYGASDTLTTSKTETTQIVALENLEEGTEYHVQIVAEDEEGNTFAGNDYTFETLPVPKITRFKLQQVAGEATATLRLLWTSNSLISTVVTYYPANNPVATKDSINLVLSRNHQVILNNLLDDTDYTVVIKGKDSAGNEAEYPAQSVKTAADLRPPGIENMNVETTIIGVGDQAKAQVVATWDTDEPASTQVEYAEGTGTSYNLSTQEDTNKTTNHSVTITGLSPSRIYHLRAVGKDKAANVGNSFDTVIVTPKGTKDALNLVIDNLAKTFGFLKSVKTGK